MESNQTESIGKDVSVLIVLFVWTGRILRLDRRKKCVVCANS